MEWARNTTFHAVYRWLPASTCYVAPTPKFKRTRVSLFVHDRLDPDRVALGALLPYVQKRGTGRIPRERRWSGRPASFTTPSFRAGFTRLATGRLSATRWTSSATATWVSPSSKGDPAAPRDGLSSRLESNGGFEPQLRRAGEAVSDRPGQGAGQRQDPLRRFPLHRGDVSRGSPSPSTSWERKRGSRGDAPQALAEHHHELLPRGPSTCTSWATSTRTRSGTRSPRRLSRPVERCWRWSPRGELGEGPERTVIQEEPMNQGWLVLGLRTDIRRSDPLRYGSNFSTGSWGASSIPSSLST